MEPNYNQRSVRPSYIDQTPPVDDKEMMLDDITWNYELDVTETNLF